MGSKIQTKEKADILDDLIQTQTGIFVDSLSFSKYTFNSDTSGYLFTDGSINTMEMWTTTKPNTKTQDLLLYQLAKSSGLLLHLIESNEIKEGYNKLTGTVCEVHINDISNSDHEVYLDEYTLYPFFINDKRYDFSLYIRVMAGQDYGYPKNNIKLGKPAEFEINRYENLIDFDHRTEQ